MPSCSGDIHYVIALVGRMVSRAGGVEALKRRRAFPRFQSWYRIGRSATRLNFLNALRAVADRGELLVRVVTALVTWRTRCSCTEIRRT